MVIQLFHVEQKGFRMRKMIATTVTHLKPEQLARLVAAAQPYGGRGHAAAIRFCIEQFLAGRSIRDFEPQPDEQPQAAAG